MRVRTIRDMMLCDEWKPETAAVLAKEWGVAVSTVQNLSAEASRLIRNAEVRPYVRAKLIDALERNMTRVDEAFARARDEDFSPAKASEAMTKATESATRAILATAQIAGVSVADKSGPSLTINVGQVAKSDVLADLWAEPTPKTIEAHGEPIPDERPAVLTRELPARVYDGGPLSDDGWR